MFDAAPPLPHDADPGADFGHGPGPGSDRALPQSDAYIAALRALGVPVRAVPVADASVWMIVRRVPVLGRVGLISRPQLRFGLGLGPGLGDGLQDARALRRAAGVDHLILNVEDDGDADAVAAAGFRRIARPRRIAMLDLDLPEDRLRARLGQKWRNRLRASHRHGVSVRQSHGAVSAGHWLLAADRAQARGKGFRPLPPRLIAAITRADPAGATRFTAFRDGRPVAAALFIRHGARATYQIGWCSDAGRAVSAGNRVIWAAMLALRAQGVARIDLGHIDAEGAPGLTRFKLGTGARAVTLGGTWISSRVLPRREWRAHMRR